MRAFAATLGVLLTMVFPGVTSAQPLVFAAARGEQGNQVLRVVNAANGHTTASYDIGSQTDQPTVVALPDGQTVFVAIGTRLMRLRVETGAVVWSDFPQTLGQMVLSPDNARLYITQRTQAAAYVVDTVTSATIGSPIALPFVASKVAISPSGHRLFVLEAPPPQGRVASINTATGLVDSTINVPSSTIQVAIHPDGARLFAAVSNFETSVGNGDSVVAYDIASGGELGRLTLPDNRTWTEYFPGPMRVYAASSAGRMAFGPAGNRLYVPRTSSISGKGGSTTVRQVVDVVDTALLTHVTSTPLQFPGFNGLHGGAIAATFEIGSQRLWVASGRGLGEIDTTSHAIRDTGTGLLDGLRDVAVAPAPTCWFEVGAPSTVSFRNDGGEAQLSIPAPPQGCSWSATVSDPWISATPGSGSTAGTVTVIVGAGSTPRRGTLTIGGQPIPVIQRILNGGIDTPSSGATTVGMFGMVGWFIDNDGLTGSVANSGIDEVRITDETPGQAVRLLATPYWGNSRPDVGAAFGARFASSGFSATLPQLAAGRRLLVARGRSSADGVRHTLSVEVNVPRVVVSALDAPPVQDRSTPRLRLTGWAFDRNALSGCGIARVDVWAFPHSGQAPTFLGSTAVILPRSDFAALYGEQALHCGWQLYAQPLPAVGHRIVAYAFTTATGTVESESGVDVTILHKPFGVVDTPTDGAQVSGAISLTGWALDDVGVTRVAVFFNNTGQYVADAVFVDGARPDVAAAYASYPNRTRAGWGVSILTNMLPGGGNGTLFFSVVAYDADGHSTQLKLLSVTGVNNTSTLPFGQIDAPAQGATISGTVPIFGWALTPSPHIIPSDGSTIDVIVDNVVIGHPVFGQCRGTNGTNFPAAGTCNDDIARTFGSGYRNIAETSGAIGSFLLDTTRLTNGIHSLVWRVTDSGGNVQGIGSRFIYVNNPPAATGR